MSDLGEGLAYLRQQSEKSFEALRAQSRFRSLTSPKIEGSIEANLGESDHGVFGRLAQQTVEHYKEFIFRSSAGTNPSRHAPKNTSAFTIPSRLAQSDHYNLNLNDYLSLGRSSALDEAASELSYLYPVGSHGSRLLGGDHPIFRTLEKKVAQLTGFEKGLYASSGFSLNACLAGLFAFEGVRFFSDQFNHASTIDGIRSSGMEKKDRVVFSHNNISELESFLKASDAKCNVIFCEGIYSMDGDPADVLSLVALAKSYRGVVVLDEAHSFAVTGEKGLGAMEAVSLDDRRRYVVSVVTCGKALASHGAFLLGPGFVADLMINYSRSFIYSTAPSPLVAAITLVSLLSTRNMSDQRNILSQHSKRLRSILLNEGISCVTDNSQIIPILTGSNESALRLAEFLLGKNIAVGAVRPPTVSEGSSRVRVSLHAALDEGDVDFIAEAVVDGFRRL